MTFLYPNFPGYDVAEDTFCEWNKLLAVHEEQLVTFDQLGVETLFAKFNFFQLEGTFKQEDLKHVH